MSGIGPKRGATLAVAGILALLAAMLAVTAIPGTFSIDDANHIAAVLPLQHGQLGMPGTAALPPSAELRYFDPAPNPRAGMGVPMASSVPPLYGLLALPFSAFGVRGLQWLNILGTTWAAWLVWLYARRHATRRSTPWIALALLVLGGYVLEYAPGIWAHGLSLGLCTTAYWHAARARETGKLEPALLGGLVVGLAMGVRYQNAGLGLLVGGTLVLFGRNRLRQGLAYGLGAALPLALSAWLNHLRQGSWNPISKGAGYLDPTARVPVGGRLGEALHATWARLVDAAAHPPFPPGPGALDRIMPKDPDTGAFIVLGVVRKALLQSVPWFALVFVAMLVVWLPARGAEPRSRREIRVASLLAAGMIAGFATFGFRRTEGWAFNQRYLLELLPLGALCAAWTLEQHALRWRSLGLGTAAGLGAAGLTLWATSEPGTSRLLILTLPILLAGVLAVAALGGELGRIWPKGAPWLRRAVPVLTAVGFGWAALIHLGDDVRASRARRAKNEARAAAIGALFPPGPVAIFAQWGVKDPLPVLHFGHDLVVADTRTDQGRSARVLSQAMLAQGRTILVILRGMPPAIVEELAAGRRARLLAGPPELLEITPAAPSDLPQQGAR
jgi:hypothetical protein